MKTAYTVRCPIYTCALFDLPEHTVPLTGYEVAIDRRLYFIFYFLFFTRYGPIFAPLERTGTRLPHINGTDGTQKVCGISHVSALAYCAREIRCTRVNKIDTIEKQIVIYHK